LRAASAVCKASWALSTSACALARTPGSGGAALTALLAAAALTASRAPARLV
jgi:hypothetical protein